MFNIVGSYCLLETSQTNKVLRNKNAFYTKYQNFHYCFEDDDIT